MNRVVNSKKREFFEQIISHQIKCIFAAKFDQTIIETDKL